MRKPHPGMIFYAKKKLSVIVNLKIKNERDNVLTEKVDRRREWHTKFNQGVMDRSLVKSCNQGENGVLTCVYNLMIF